LTRMFKGYSSTFYLLCATALLAMLSTSVVNPLLSIYAKQLGASGIYIGLVVAGYWVSRIVLEIPSGLISTRFGYYLPMIVGLLLTAVGTFLNAFASDPIQIMLTRVLQGFGAPLFFAVSTTLIVELFDAKHRGSAMGLFQGIEFAGTIVGSTFSGLIVTSLDFRGSFLLSAVLAGLALAMLVALPQVRRHSRTIKRASSFSLSSIGKVFRSRNLMIVSSATFTEFIMTSGVLFTVFPIYAQEKLGFSITDIGFLSGARSIGFVLAMLVMGTVADRIGRKPILVLGVGLTGVLTLVMSFATSFLSFALVILVSGVTTGAIWITSPVIAAESVEPSLRGAAIGTYRTFFDLGSIVGPIIMSALMQVSGPSACFYLASALFLVNLIPAMKIRENR